MKKTLLVPCLLVVLPLCESVFLSNGLGLDWHSPLLMYQLSVVLIPLKLLLTLLGLKLLSKVNVTAWFIWLKVSVSVAGALHGLLLALICVVYLVMGPGPQSHREDGNIYVYTADAGAMGKSYHYFYYIKLDEYGFYTLQLIAKLDWLGEFNFQQKENLLIIDHKDFNGEQIKQLDLTAFRGE